MILSKLEKQIIRLEKKFEKRMIVMEKIINKMQLEIIILERCCTKPQIDHVKAKKEVNKFAKYIKQQLEEADENV